MTAKPDHKVKRIITSPDLSKMTRIQVDAKTIIFKTKVKPVKKKKRGNFADDEFEFMIRP